MYVAAVFFLGGLPACVRLCYAGVQLMLALLTHPQVAHATRDSVEQQGEQVRNVAAETERIGANLEAADYHVKYVGRAGSSRLLASYPVVLPH